LATAVGVAGVLVLAAVANGARSAIVARIGSLGRNMLVVTAATIESRGGRAVRGADRARSLRAGDADALLRGSSAVRRVAPAQDRGMVARYGAVQAPATVVGTTPEWQPIRQFALAEGRFFTDQENAARARVAVIGSAIRASLFPDSVNPVGRTIRLGVVPVEVVGVLVSKGMSVDGYATEDDRIFVPLETALRRLFNVEYLKSLYVEAASAPALDVAEQDVRAILAERHGTAPGMTPDFQVQNQQVILAAELATQSAFQRLIAGLAALSLLVGGIGILSIMLLAVRERRHEIGLRVAVGARRVDIVVQFLAESLLLALAGGAAGVGVGSVAAMLVSALTAWDARVTAAPMALAIGSALALGVTCGVAPAWRAARLDPVEALRAE
jgi:putative ABC transport system permease protein